MVVVVVVVYLPRNVEHMDIMDMPVAQDQDPDPVQVVVGERD